MRMCARCSLDQPRSGSGSADVQLAHGVCRGVSTCRKLETPSRADCSDSCSPRPRPRPRPRRRSCAWRRRRKSRCAACYAPSATAAAVRSSPAPPWSHPPHSQRAEVGPCDTLWCFEYLTATRARYGFLCAHVKCQSLPSRSTYRTGGRAALRQARLSAACPAEAHNLAQGALRFCAGAGAGVIFAGCLHHEAMACRLVHAAQSNAMTWSSNGKHGHSARCLSRPLQPSPASCVRLVQRVRDVGRGTAG